MKCASLEAKGPAVHLLLCCRYVTGEVSTIVMRADEETVEARSQLEAVEKVLQVRSFRLSKILPELFYQNSCRVARTRESDQKFEMK